jgi:acetoin utilization deacetylase AcuC-like enzyme
MRGFYTDRFVLPLPEGHRFPMRKYSRLRERCVAEGVLRESDLLEPRQAEWEELALAHGELYLHRVREGTLEPAEQRRIGFPWSPGMVERSRRSVGGTISAAEVALEERSRAPWGVAVNLAGGTHHAHANHGEGFCVFNDVAVAVRVLQSAGRIRTAAVVDCDVHQGNGTAAIFATDPTVFTLSIQGARNYPFRRERSTVDVELPDGSGDEVFLEALRLELPPLLDRFRPDLVFYLAGADPHEGDRLGRLALTKTGLRDRDAYVLERCRSAGVPVAITMAGGYGRDTEDTVDIHLATIATARALREELVAASASRA